MHSTLKTLSDEPTVAASAPATCSQAVKTHLASIDRIFDTLSRTNLEGYFDCSTTASTVGIKAKKSHFAYIDEIFKDPEHASVLGRLIFYKQDGRTIPFMGMHVPLYADGDFNGTIGSALYMEDFMGQKFNTANSFARADFIIVDNNEDILYEANMDQQTTKLKNSRTADLNFQKVLSDVIAGREKREAIVNDGDNYLIERVEVFPGREWVFAVSISQHDLILSTETSGLGMRLIKLDDAQRLLAAGIMALMTAAALLLVQRMIIRGVRND